MVSQTRGATFASRGGNSSKDTVGRSLAGLIVSPPGSYAGYIGYSRPWDLSIAPGGSTLSLAGGCCDVIEPGLSVALDGGSSIGPWGARCARNVYVSRRPGVITRRGIRREAAGSAGDGGVRVQVVRDGELREGVLDDAEELDVGLGEARPEGSVQLAHLVLARQPGHGTESSAQAPDQGKRLAGDSSHFLTQRDSRGPRPLAARPLTGSSAFRGRRCPTATQRGIFARALRMRCGETEPVVPSCWAKSETRSSSSSQ